MNPEAMREIDRFLRRAAVIGPMIGTLIGFCAGFVSAVIMFRDLEKKANECITWRAEHDRSDKKQFEVMAEFMSAVRERLKIPK